MFTDIRWITRNVRATNTDSAVVSESQIPWMMLLVLSFKMATVLGEVLNKMKYSFPSIYLIIIFLEIPGHINVLICNTELGSGHRYKQDFQWHQQSNETFNILLDSGLVLHVHGMAYNTSVPCSQKPAAFSHCDNPEYSPLSPPTARLGLLFP